MTEYRIPLEGGDVLVLTMEIEAAEEQEVDPTSIGVSLLKALGLSSAGRPSVTKPKELPPEVIAARKANDENPDTWLRRTSEQSLKTRFPRKLRADGDTD